MGSGVVVVMEGVADGTAAGVVVEDDGIAGVVDGGGVPLSFARLNFLIDSAPFSCTCLLFLFGALVPVTDGDWSTSGTVLRFLMEGIVLITGYPRMAFDCL
jgi:hypothetical protein